MMDCATGKIHARWGGRVILVLLAALLVARAFGYVWSWWMLLGPAVAFAVTWVVLPLVAFAVIFVIVVLVKAIGGTVRMLR